MTWTSAYLFIRQIPGWVWGLLILVLLTWALWSARSTVNAQAAEIAVLRTSAAADQRVIASLEIARKAESAARQQADAALAVAMQAADAARRQADAALAADRRAIEAEAEAIDRAAASGTQALADQVNAMFGGDP
jgi:hypothetical protein